MEITPAKAVAKVRAAELALVVLALVGGVAIAAYFYAANRVYYPVAAISAPEGVTYTAFSLETQGRDACEEANARFLEPLREQCPRCKLVFERCVDRQEAVELQLAAQRSPSVSVPGLRIVVAGAAAPARLACEQVAADLAKHGMNKGRCEAPRK